MNIVEVATVVGGFATGAGALFAVAAVSVAALQIREQQRFQAAQLFMQNFADAANLLRSLRDLFHSNLPDAKNDTSTVYSMAAMLGHKVASMARLRRYAMNIVDDEDICFLQDELRDVKSRLEKVFTTRRHEGDLSTVLIFADQVITKSLARLEPLLPKAA